MNSQKNLFSRRLLTWYDRSRRQLPWRAARGSHPPPYHVLVSELMLQQTQVSTVIPYFDRFICAWPNIEDLARADEQAVLRAWQGLGYYSRARNLLAAARKIVADHDAQIPRDLESLLSLPGIGRYTAGAIASLAFDLPAPILDGNVARVLCRLYRIKSDPKQPETKARLWKLAESVLPEKRIGDFNSALMELGATVCTPRSPQCLICPVRDDCKAFAAGEQDQIPLRAAAKQVRQTHRWTFCIRHRGRWLIEQRPATGRWASMWQFITVPAKAASPKAADVHVAAAIRTSAPKHIGGLEHALTHRKYQFEVYLCDLRGQILRVKNDSNRRWVRLDELAGFPLPRPHLKIAEMLGHLPKQASNSALKAR